MAEDTQPSEPDVGEQTRAKRVRDEHRGRRILQGFAVYAGFQVISIVLWGRDVIGNMSSRAVGIGGEDYKLYTWMLRWWPFALSHAHNPFLSDTVWAPTGVNMAWVTGLPGPGLLTGLITSRYGPMVSANLLFLAGPALAAWAVYLVCRRVTDRFWPSVAGGLLFGILGTYEVAQMLGHLNLVLMFPVPLVVYVVLRRMQNGIGRAAFIALMIVLVIAEFSISTEITVTMLFVGAIALAGTYILGPRELQRPIVSVSWQIAIGTGIALVLLSPYLYYALLGSRSCELRNPIAGSTDLTAFLTPSRVAALGGSLFRRFRGPYAVNDFENGAYLGIPLIAVLVHFALTNRTRAARLLLILAGGMALLMLGPFLQIRGVLVNQSQTGGWIPLPWMLLRWVPFLKNALPARLSLYFWLALALIVSMWLASRPPPVWGRWGVFGLVFITLFPNTAVPPFAARQYVPPFLADGTYQQYIEPNETVMLMPEPLFHQVAHGQDMLWQADTGMYFRMPQGYTGLPPQNFKGTAVVRQAALGTPGDLTPAELEQFARTHGVGALLVADGNAAEWQPILLQAFGVTPRHIGGMWLYDLPYTNADIPPGQRTVSPSAGPACPPFSSGK